jgi:predicted DsbA family dithiol-disulfide isomerase
VTPYEKTQPNAKSATQFDRRQAILLSMAVTAVLGAAVYWRPRQTLTYQTLQGLTPFRQLISDGARSTGSVALLGMNESAAGSADAALGQRGADVRADLCGALFGTGFGDERKTPLAYFTDVNCPNCRILEHGLASVTARDPTGLHLVRHELPLLGPASVIAARALLAAETQGRRKDLAKRLTRASFVTDEAFIGALAGSLGIDVDRMLIDMKSSPVEAHLRTSQALARIFGLAGVPALVVGRTLIVGAVPGDTISRVIDDERAMPTAVCPA